MKKSKSIVARNSDELAEALGLPPEDAVEMEVRSDLNDMIIKAVEQKKLTHAAVATLAKTSRTRVTAILNRNTHEVSTDLMLRILGCLGYRAKIKFYPAA